MAERLKKEKEEQHLYLQINLISATHFRFHSGFDLTSADLGNGDMTALRVRKETLVRDFTQKAAEKMGLEPGCITLWIFISRQNGTRRPHEPLLRANIKIQQAFLDAGFTGTNPQIWVEVIRAETGVPVPVPRATSGEDTILIFVKNFDVVKQTLRGVTSLCVRKDSTVRPHLLTLMEWSEDTRFSVHEVSSQLQPFQFLFSHAIGLTENHLVDKLLGSKTCNDPQRRP